MTALVSSPSGKVEKCTVQVIEKNRYCIKFVPKEMGVHTVSVKHRGVHIPGKIAHYSVTGYVR